MNLDTRLRWRWIMLPMLVVVTALVAPRRALALDPQVRDDGGFFSPQAVQQADDVIRPIKSAQGKDLMIETYPSIPPEMQSGYSADRKDQFFQQWAEKRGEDLGVNGVLVLICKNPAHIYANSGKGTRQKAFTPSDVDRLTQILA